MRICKLMISTFTIQFVDSELFIIYQLSTTYRSSIFLVLTISTLIFVPTAILTTFPKSYQLQTNIRNTNHHMQCPKCHGHSVIIKEGTKYCQAKGCTFMAFHVISYENQIRQFEGEKGPENRFSFSVMGQHKQKQSKVEKNFYTANKVIRDLANAMKLSIDLIDKAESKLVRILKIKYPQQQKNDQEDEQKNREKQKQKINISNANIAAYCLYAACFDKKMYFKDVRIANQMGIPKYHWTNMVKQLTIKLKDFMTVPHFHLEHYVMRVSRKRKIAQIEENAMLEMVKRVKQAEIIGGSRPNTIAACIFWQIMLRSERYVNDNFDMRQYLWSRQREDQKQGYWRQTHFQVSFEAIKKFKNEYLGSRLPKLIPNFQGRIPEEELNSKNT